MVDDIVQSADNQLMTICIKKYISDTKKMLHDSVIETVARIKQRIMVIGDNLNHAQDLGDQAPNLAFARNLNHAVDLEEYFRNVNVRGMYA